MEINPRMASQFADLYEKVDSWNTYSLLLDLALNRPPLRPCGAGRHAAAASCVLRRFDDALVVKSPSEDELKIIQSSHPDARIEVLATPGERLSQQLQDGYSFRYGIVSIGGGSRQEARRSFDWCRQHLSFTFEPVISAARPGRFTVPHANKAAWPESGELFAMPEKQTST